MKQRKYRSKGDRLNWTPLKEHKRVVLRDLLYKGEVVKKNNNNSDLLLIP
ncbi:hypothetical protein [Tenacibaculum aiptasiae]|nr:hypothetical protein [Tenacibaculum aiptasiae]